MRPQSELTALLTASRRVGEELGLLEERIERLETALESHLQSSSFSGDSYTIEAIQEIDMVRQTISALSSFLLTISDLEAHHEEADFSEITRRVPLRDVASRLAGTPPPNVGKGEAELF